MPRRSQRAADWARMDAIFALASAAEESLIAPRGEAISTSPMMAVGSPPKQDDVIGKVDRFVETMRDEQSRDLGALDERGKLFAQARRKRHVERDERLVENEKIGPHGKGARERDAAREAERQFARIMAQMVAEPEIARDLLDILVARLRRGETQIVEDAAPGQKPRLLKHHADPRVLRDIDAAFEILVETDQDTQQRRLAGAGGADQRIDFAQVHRHREIAQHLAPLARCGAEGLALDDKLKRLSVASGKHVARKVVQQRSRSRA